MANGWNLKKHCHLTVARHMSEKIQPKLVRCDAQRKVKHEVSTVQQLVNIIEDQGREQSAEVIVWIKESAFWKHTSFTALLRKVHLKCIDVGEQRVITNNRCGVADQIKGGQVENIAKDGVEIKEFGTVGKRAHSKGIVVDAVKIWKCVETVKIRTFWEIR